MDFKKTYEELNVLLLFNPNMKVQQAQHEKMVVMSFLAGLPPEFETAKSHILFSSEILSLQDIVIRVLRTESTVSAPPSSRSNSAMVSGSNVNDPGRPHHKNNNRGSTSNNDNQS